MKKKVVLLGDSIRLIGYGTLLPSLVESEFEVWQSEDNGRFVQNILRELVDYREQIEEAEIVHFNTGEWDVCNLFADGTFTPEDFYKDQLVRIAKILLAQGKKVVFATTTPVLPTHPFNSNDDIRRFNEIAVSALAPLGVVFNDLYSVVMEDLEGNIRADDQIHLTEKGIRLCAEATAEVLRSL